jgi:hypothetical protein
MHYLGLFYPSLSNPVAKRSPGVNTSFRSNDLPSYFTAHLLNTQNSRNSATPYRASNRQDTKNQTKAGNSNFQWMRLRNIDTFPTYIERQERNVLITDAVIRISQSIHKFAQNLFPQMRPPLTDWQNPWKKADSLNIYPPIIDIMFIGIQSRNVTKLQQKR